MYDGYKTRLGRAIMQSNRSGSWPFYGVIYGLLVSRLMGAHSHSLNLLGFILALLIPILGLIFCVVMIIEMPGIFGGGRGNSQDRELGE